MVKIKYGYMLKRWNRVKKLSKTKYSANKIQKILQKEGLGIRRKALLAELRYFRKKEITKEKRVKAIPKKYRKPIIVKPIPIKELIELYRVSYIIPSIPVHSRPFKRRYLGFRLNAFSINKRKLLNNHTRLRRLLIELTSQYLRADVLNWNNWYITVGREYPTITFVSRKLNNVWIFSVEQEGKEQYSKSGIL